MDLRIFDPTSRITMTLGCCHGHAPAVYLEDLTGDGLTTTEIQRLVIEELPLGICAKPLDGTAHFLLGINLGATVRTKTQSRAQAAPFKAYIRCPLLSYTFIVLTMRLPNF